jgi:hypothetical protein
VKVGDNLGLFPYGFVEFAVYDRYRIDPDDTYGLGSLCTGCLLGKHCSMNQQTGQAKGYTKRVDAHGYWFQMDG